MRRPHSAIPSEPDAVWSRSETLALVALYLGVRAAFLIGNPTYFYNGIDAYLGAAANDFLRGDALPLLDYQYNNYNPATWVFTALAVPFVRLGGPFHQSVNVLLLLVHAAIFSGWLVFGQRYVGRSATRWGALLWAAPPPFLLWMSMALKGGHHFMIVTQLFAFACLIELRRTPSADRARELRLLFLLGVSTGLGCWWSLMFWTAAPVIGLLLLLESGRRLRLPALAVLASAFLLGYAPAIYYNWTRDLQGFSVQEAPFWSWFLDAPREAPGRLWALLTRELPESYRFASLTLGRLYAAATLAAWAYLVWRHRAELRLLSPLRILRRRPAPPVSPALYLASLYAAFFLALAVSSFAREPDYFATPHIQGAILLGLAFAALAARGRKAAVAAGRWAILGASAASIAIAYVQGAPAYGPALDGLSDGKYGFWLGYRYVKDPDFVFARIAAFPASRRPNLYKGAGYGMSWLVLSTPPRPSQMTEMMAIAERVPTESRSHFLDGLAVELAGDVSGDGDGVRREVHDVADRVASTHVGLGAPPGVAAPNGGPQVRRR
ncbi:MAG: hypothetical protein K8I02_08085, partial [Candidatus Methylomirabilis sp.]|nr:hypothetical protein [Deltaproteobacteria bacterium]